MTSTLYVHMHHQGFIQNCLVGVRSLWSTAIVSCMSNMRVYKFSSFLGGRGTEAGQGGDSRGPTLCTKLCAYTYAYMYILVFDIYMSGL